MLTTMPTASRSMPAGAWRPMKRTRVPTSNPFSSVAAPMIAEQQRTNPKYVPFAGRTRLLRAVLDTGSAVEMLTAKTFVSNESCQSLAVP
jgi:hypothetical protein